MQRTAAAMGVTVKDSAVCANLLQRQGREAVSRLREINTRPFYRSTRPMRRAFVAPAAHRYSRIRRRRKDFQPIDPAYRKLPA